MHNDHELAPSQMCESKLFLEVLTHVVMRLHCSQSSELIT